MNSTLLYCIAVHLDEHARTAFSLVSSEVLSFVTSLWKDQHFWYLRAQTLVSYKLEYKPTLFWSGIYETLSEALTEENPFLKTLMCSFCTSVLLQLGYDPTMDGDQALYEAADLGEVETVKLLLADGRVDWTQHDPVVYLLIENRETEVLLTLVPDLDYSDGTIIEQVIIDDLPEVLQAMLQQPTVDPARMPHCSPGEDALIMCIDYNSLGCAKVLLEDGRCNHTSSRLFRDIWDWSSRMTDLLLTDERIRASRP